MARLRDLFHYRQEGGISNGPTTVYLNAKDPSIVGAALLNGVMDALDTAFALSGGDRVLGRNTLNGTAYHCRIDGKALKYPGDLDGDALLIVPVKIVLP